MTRLRPVLTALRRYAVPALAVLGLAAGLAAQYLLKAPDAGRLILLVTLLAGGLPVVVDTAWGMLRREFAADIVATLAIVGAAVTGEYLAGCVIVLMQTGGEALEAHAVRRASAALEALLARAPRGACRAGEAIEDVPVEEVAVGDLLLVRPGELIPVDGTVLDGMAAVDASALMGEPVRVPTGAGDEVPRAWSPGKVRRATASWCSVARSGPPLGVLYQWPHKALSACRRPVRSASRPLPGIVRGQGRPHAHRRCEQGDARRQWHRHAGRADWPDRRGERGVRPGHHGAPEPSARCECATCICCPSSARCG